MKNWLVALLLVSPLLSAATPKEELKAKLQAIHSMQAEFSQQVFDAQQHLLQTTSGHFYVSQPNKLRWEVTLPDESTLIADGDSLWLVDPFAEQVTAMEQAGAVDNNPIVLMTVPDNPAWEQFTITLADGGFQVDASDEQSHVQRLVFYFDGALLSKMRILDRQQQQSELSFSNIKVNQPLNQQLFIFSMPDGFELDDQRHAATGL